MFKKAVKGTRKFRIALDGPTGAGKTYTALAVACALSQKVCLIDTERGSASLYADKFDFDTCDLTTHSPKNYCETIKAAVKAGYEAIVIDSLSHAWMGKDGALEQVDKAAKRSQSGNTFAAWRDVTPMHNELVDTIVSADAHIIVTMRTKMEYILEEVTRNGKTTRQPRKVGLAPIQRDGVEYEFDIVADLDLDHNLMISKTRLDTLDGLVMNKPGAEFAGLLKDWLSTTVSSPSTSVDSVKQTVAEAKQQETPQQTPATPAAPPADDPDRIMDDADWEKLNTFGQAKGWGKVDIYGWLHKTYNLAGGGSNFKQNVSKEMGRAAYAHIAAGNKPEKK